MKPVQTVVLAISLLSSTFSWIADEQVDCVFCDTDSAVHCECEKKHCMKCSELCHHSDNLNNIFANDESKIFPETSVDDQNSTLNDAESNNNRELEFIARPGTIDFGRKFEVNVTALYALKLSLNEDVKDFYIASNADGYGAFDDILIRVEYKTGQKELFAIQLKHKLNELTILKDDFNKQKSQFFLEKYRKSYENDVKSKFENTENILTQGLSLSNLVLCLFTNASIQQDSKFFNIDLQLNCKTITCTENDFINTKRNVHHKFHVNVLYPTFIEFVCQILQENFYYEITQVKSTNEKLLKSIDSGILEEIIDAFQNQLRQQFLFGEINSKDAIEETILAVNRSFQREDITSYIADFFKKEISMIAKAYDLNYRNADYTNYVSELLLCKYKEELEEIRSKNEDLFTDYTCEQIKGAIDYFLQTVQDQSKSSKKQIKEIDENVLQCIKWHFQYKYKKEKGNKYLEFFTKFRFYDGQIDYKEAEESISDLLKICFGEDLFHITKQIIEFVGEHFEQKNSILLTKRFVKMKLLELITVLNDEELKENYQTFENVTNLQVDEQRGEILKTIRVSLQGRKTCNLYDLADASFTRSLSSTFLLKNIGKVIQVGKRLNTKPENYLRRKVYKILLEERVLWETNESIFLIDVDHKDYVNQRVYVTNKSPQTLNNLPFPHEKNIVILLGGYKAADYVSYLKKNFNSYAVHYLKLLENNLFEWKESWGSVEQLNNFIIEYDIVDEEQILKYFNYSLNVICAPLGMGKTTILDTLYDYCDYDDLILRLNLNEHRKILCQDHSDFYQNPCDYICKIMQSTPANDFECQLIRYLVEKKKVILFIDAYDEITAEFSERVLKTLNQLQLTIWVATRSTAKSSIQKAFKIMPINIQPLSNEDSERYLTKETCHSRNEISDFLKTTELFKTPLHLIMLLEIINNNKNSLHDLKLRELYKSFIQLKYDLALKKNNEINNSLLMAKGDDKFLNYKLMALCFVYGKEFLIKCKIVEESDIDQLMDYFRQSQDPLSLINVMQGEVLNFTHRSYAEFLTALWLSENTQHKNFKPLYHHLINPEYHAIRNIFDRLVCENDPLYLAVLDLNREKLTELCTARRNFKDKHGRTPLHIAVSYFKCDDVTINECRTQTGVIGELVRLLPENCILEKDSLLEWDWWEYVVNSEDHYLMHAAAYWGQIGILELFKTKLKSGKSDFINRTDKFGRTALYLASLNDQIDCVKFLIKEKANVNLDKYKPIFIASEKGYLSVLELLVNAKCNVRQSDEDGRTALHFAASGGHTNCIQFLLSKGAKASASTHLFVTPLFVAACNGHAEALKLLLKSKTDAKVITFNGLSSLHISAINGHTECVKLLLEANADVNGKNRKGCTPLYLAAENGHLDVVAYLIEKGANVDEINSDQMTPLQIASSNGHSDCVKHLIEKDANVNAEDIKRRTALFLASEFGHSQILKMLLDNNAIIDKTNIREWTALHAAASNGHTECLKILIQKNPDGVNAKEINQCSSMHFSSNLGNLDALKLLIDNGAEVDDRNMKLWTPLHFTALQGHIECAEFLIQAGADIDLKNDQKYTALHIAVQEGKAEVVQLLVNNEASVNEVNANGFTALHIAAKNGHIDSVRILINTDADVNFKIKDTYTPAYCAVKFGHLDVLKCLIDKGKINVHEVNKSGQTYLHTASAFRQIDVIKFLLKRKVDVEITDFKKETALDVAMRIRHWDCVEPIQKYKKRWTYVNLEEVAIQQKDQLKALGNVRFFNMDEQKILRNMAEFGYAPLSASVAADCIHIAKYIMDQFVEKQIETIDQFNLLQIAAKNGHLNILKWLLKKGANVNAVDNYGRTALFLASRMGFLRCTKLLINAGSDKSIASVKGYTSFLISAKFGHVEVIKELFDEFCLKMRTDRGKSGLLLAASHGHLKTIRYLLQRNINVDGEDEDSCTSLMYATKHGHLECVQYLVENKANINRQNLLGDAALHIAAEEGNLDIIIFLISRNADPNIINKKGRTPDQVALNYRHGSCAKFLVDSLHFWKLSKCDKKLLDTVEEINLTNQRSLMEKLIKKGCPKSCAAVYTGNLNAVKRFANAIHGRQSDKYRPLISAAERGYLDIIQWLISEGVDVDTSNCHGKTALFKAARNGHLLCVQFLLAKGADINFQSRKGNVPLLVSVKHNQFDVVKLLISKGAEIDIQEYNGKSALNLAAEKGHLSILKYLQMRGADINRPDSDGCTPVMLALSNDHADCTRFLIEKECNLNGQKFDDGNTLLHVAAFKDYITTVKDLIKKGVDPCILNYKNESSVDVATGESARFLNHFIIKKYGLTEKMKKEIIFKGHQIDAKNFMCQWQNLISTNSTKLVPIHLAAGKGYSTILQSLINYGVDVDETDDKGRTALFAASRENHLKCVEILLDKDANVNASDKNGCTPLLTASWFGNLDVFKILLQKRAHLEVKDMLGRTPLMLAARNGHLHIVKYLMGLRINFDECNTQGNTAITYAAEYGHLECVRVLVEKSTAINSQDIDGDTPLHCAAFRGHLDIIKLLVSKGADPTIINKSGKSQAAVACRHENEICVEYLEEIVRLRKELKNYIKSELEMYPYCQEVLMATLLNGHIDVVKNFVDNWRKACTSNNIGLIPLHIAVADNQIMLVELLIERGANLDEVNAHRCSALYLACAGNHLDGVQLLIDRGSNINLPNVTGSTPLHVAVQFSDLKIIKLLLTKGANLRAKDNFDRSVLITAAKFGRLEVMQYLLGIGIEVNDVDKNGNNALAVASNHGFLECVKLLVRKGIDLNRSDRDGDTALHCAAFQGHQNILEFLISQGVNPRIANKNGDTAGDVASRRSRKPRVYNKFWTFLRWLFFRKFLHSI